MDTSQILTSQRLASAVLKSCFKIVDSEIYLNYNKIFGIFQTLHLTSIALIDGTHYRHITPVEIRQLYLAYTEVAENTYVTTVDSKGDLTAKASNEEIPEWIFNIVATIINLNKRIQ